MTKMQKQEIVDHLYNDYIEAALFFALDSDGAPLDRRFSTSDFTKSSKKLAKQDITRFVELVGIVNIRKAIDLENRNRSVGHELWLAQNGSEAFVYTEWGDQHPLLSETAYDEMKGRRVEESGNKRYVNIVRRW